jgi:glycosyltransferase involved in cell wall biosynthesis
VHRFLAVSRFVRQKHLEGGLSPERVRVKEHFVWPAPRREGPGEYFLYLGRLSPEKGVMTLLPAAADLRVRLLIVGDGPQAEEIRQGLPRTAELMGLVSPEELPGLVAGARALLVPSVWYEPAGRVVMEAYASGVPVIASRIGALPEVVEEGVTGLLADPGSREAWTRAMAALSDDRESERLGEGAFRAWSDRYTPDRGVRELEAAYEEAIAARGDGRQRR